MNRYLPRVLALLLAAAPALAAQQPGDSRGRSLSRAQEDLQRQVQESATELAELRERIESERLPLARRLNELENEFLLLRDEYQGVKGTLDSHTVDIASMTRRVEQRRQGRKHCRYHQKP